MRARPIGRLDPFLSRYLESLSAATGLLETGPDDDLLPRGFSVVFCRRMRVDCLLFGPIWHSLSPQFAIPGTWFLTPSSAYRA
jgi:hypothetical protein